MNYSENKTYGRKIIKNEKKKRQFVVSAVLFVIGISIASLMISGIIHIFCCRCTTPVEVTTTKPIEEKAIVKMVETPEPEIINLGEYKLTAYCACEECCGKTDGITASGVKAVEGVTVAADTTIHPFGTKLFINGHEYTVQDKGAAIKGNKVDIFFDNHQEALEFGVQHKEIFTVKEGEN